MDILDTLQAGGKIEAEHVEKVRASVAQGVSLEQALLTEGIDKAIVREAFADFYEIPSRSISQEVEPTIQQDILEYIPVEAAKNYQIVPLAIENETLIVGVNDPEDLRLKEAMSFVSSKHGIPYKFVFLLEEDLVRMQKVYDSLSGEVDQALDVLESELDQEIAERQAEKNNGKQVEEYIKEDAPVTKVVATILRYAVDGTASDIHIEPTDEKVRVRFRVDGELSTSLELPKNVQSAVVARIKILSSMRLDEKRKPQDGRFSATFDGRKIDFRVSILPTSHGEKVVMRILDNEKGVRTLEDTGVSDHLLQVVKKMVNEPYGIILISGPTGSGKSTTLYAMLEEVDRIKKNVMSLEDPVEYNMEGVSQSQMRPEIGYTFANGLRTALRQDPDIILVGEIRDRETAQLAIQAALTGHLVLSTIHTNNSIGVIPRLIDMGIDPYLIAPTLKLAIAQRLARRTCPGTGEEVPVDESVRQMFENDFASLPERYRDRIPAYDTVVHPVSSPGCASGTKGRIAVMEALQVNGKIQSMILNNASEEEIYDEARKIGFMSMKEDANIKALQGLIPFEEVAMFGSKVEGDLLEEAPPVDNPASEPKGTV